MAQRSIIHGFKTLKATGRSRNDTERRVAIRRGWTFL